MRDYIIRGLLVAGTGIAAGLAVYAWLGGDLTMAVALGLTAALVIIMAIIARWWRQARATLRALETGVDAFADGDFSFSLKSGRRDALGGLVDAHNRLGKILREQRQSLLQRELLLDTVVRNSPLALLLFDTGGHVVMANLEARKMLAGGRRLEGNSRNRLIETLPPELAEALAQAREGLTVIEVDEREEVVHLSFQNFTLNARAHQLVLIKPLTREIARQEVRTWKKVIRVISHELNNSLGPIKSLARSGLEEAEATDDKLYQRILGTIGERAEHLHEFLSGYVAVAKLPAPRPDEVSLEVFFAKLADGWAFKLQGDITGGARFDPVLLEQALINLLKNAHESGSDPEKIVIGVVRTPGRLKIRVRDRGPGMNQATLAQAMVPFYSTKRAGSGIGLALAREIVEAHDGRIELTNRRRGGLEVTLTLPE